MSSDSARQPWTNTPARNARLRILMLAQFYAPIIGGEERLVQDLSRELAARGHSVAVATLWHKGLPEFELDGPVQIYRIRSLVQTADWVFKETGRQHAPPWPDPVTVRALRRVIDQHRPEIVHAHNWLVHSFLPLKQPAGPKLIVSLHDYSLVCAKKRLMYRGQPCTGPQLAKCLACAGEHYGLAKGLPTTLATFLSGRWERDAVDLFLPVSQTVANVTRLDRGSVPYQIIPNFVPAAVSAPPDQVEPYVAQLPPGQFLLFVGDLSLDKGVGFLLEAHAGLRQAPPLVLIGRRSGDTPKEFPANVNYLGPWPHEAVAAAWRRCRIALVPSHVPETFGLVALEAMAAGRPVIASRAGGLPDIVIDGETGLLVPPGDPQALRDAMARLLAAPGLCERLGQAGQLRANAFRAAAVVPQFEEAYRRVLQQEQPEAQPGLLGATPQGEHSGDF